MDVTDVMAFIPYVEHLGIEITEAADGHAEGELPLTDELSSNPERRIAHGGATFSLADTVGGAAVFSLNPVVTPTIDMRIDYVNPATSDLTAEATVIRNGESVAVTDIEVRDDEGTMVASARGVYKTGGSDGDSTWTGDRDIEAILDD